MNETFYAPIPGLSKPYFSLDAVSYGKANIDVKSGHVSDGNGIFVVTNMFRPNVFCDVSLYDGLSDVDEFKEDLKFQVEYINSHTMGDHDMQVLVDASYAACQKHISHFGRLFLTDMLTYIDIWAILHYLRFTQDRDKVVQQYLRYAQDFGHEFNDSVKCSIGFGRTIDFNTWASNQGL